MQQPAASRVVVHAIVGIPDPAVKKVESGVGRDAIVGVLNGETLDDRPVFSAGREFNDELAASAIDYRVGDVARVSGRQESRCQGYRRRNDYLPGVGSRLHHDGVT